MKGRALLGAQKKLPTVGNTVHSVESVTDKNIINRANNVLICLFTNCVEG